MNLAKLQEAEALFLQQYPDGFDDESLVQVRKRHNIDRLTEFASMQLDRARFNQPHAICEDVLKIVSRASMVSRFEKPAFRTFIESLNSDDEARFAAALEQRLYGRNKRSGFETMCEMMAPYKIAKWSVVSAVPFYLAPKREVFVKPTTAKGIVRYLEADSLVYNPTPSWEFYVGYRDLIKAVKARVSKSLAPNNAALTGFLMMSI